MCIYKKKGILLLLIILLTAIFTACQTSMDKQDKVHLEDNIISTIADAETVLSDASVYEGFAYLVNLNNIIMYDLVSGERKVISDATGNTTICADNANLYTYNKEQNSVIKFDTNGKVIRSYPSSYSPIDAVRMIKNDNVIIILAQIKGKDDYPESVLYKLDLSTEKYYKISEAFKGSESYSYICSIDFIDKNTIMIASIVSKSFMNPIVKAYRFDLQKEKVLEDFLIPYYSTYSYNAEKKGFYYVDSTGDLVENINRMNIRCYYHESTADEILRTINSDTQSYADNTEQFSFIDRIFYTNDNLILWNKLANCFIITSLSSEIEPLKIMTSDNVMNLLHLPIIMDQFEAEYGYPVRIIEYPEDIYAEKLRTKLLAGDSDYDILLLNDPTKENLLDSILKHDLYEPLDNYNGIISNISQMYKGIQSMMSYEDKLFGIPYALRTNIQAINCDLDKYGYTLPDKHWNNGALWKLCDEIIQSKDQNVAVIPYPTLIVSFMQDYVQDAINKNNIDKESLINLLIHIKKYSDNGVLFDRDFSINKQGTKKHLIIPAVLYFDHFLTNYNDIPDYPVNGTVVFPTYDGRNYINLNGCAFISKFSTNKEMAAKLLEVMTRSENIYNSNIYPFAMLGSDLTKYDKYNKWSATQLSYLSDLPIIFENAGVYTYDFNTLNSFILDSVMPGFFDGSISPEEVADMIYDQVNYTYFE